MLPWLFFVVFVALAALAIVRLRYARGELSRDEYLQATADLGGAPRSAP